MMKLRFDTERSNLEDMPSHDRKSLFEVLELYADGAVQMVNKQWTGFEINDNFVNQTYLEEAKKDELAIYDYLSR